MIITPVPFKLELENDPGRSLGLHLTQITSQIAFATGYLNKKYKDEDGDDESFVYRVSPGLAWEEWIHPKHPELLYHPGELVISDIAMTPDGVSFEGQKPIVHEFKFTWKSMRRESDLSGEWTWMAQMMSYCNAFGTDTAILHVFWVNGDYRNSGPAYRLYRITFTERELRENWASVLNNKPM